MPKVVNASDVLAVRYLVRLVSSLELSARSDLAALSLKGDSIKVDARNVRADEINRLHCHSHLIVSRHNAALGISRVF